MNWHAYLQEPSAGKMRQPIDFDREWSKRFGSTDMTSASVMSSAQRQTPSRSLDAVSGGGANDDEQHHSHHGSLAAVSEHADEAGARAERRLQDVIAIARAYQVYVRESRKASELANANESRSRGVRSRQTLERANANESHARGCRSRQASECANDNESHALEGRSRPTPEDADEAFAAVEHANGSRTAAEQAAMVSRHVQGKRSQAAPLVHALQGASERYRRPGTEAILANERYKRPSGHHSGENTRSPSVLDAGDRAVEADVALRERRPSPPFPPSRYRRDLPEGSEPEKDMHARQGRKQAAPDEAPRGQKWRTEHLPSATRAARAGHLESARLQHPPPDARDAEFPPQQAEREVSQPQAKRSKGSNVSERARRVEAALARSSSGTHRATRCALVCLSLPESQSAAASRRPTATPSILLPQSTLSRCV
jgi:hypothetical protein